MLYQSNENLNVKHSINYILFILISKNTLNNISIDNADK